MLAENTTSSHLRKSGLKIKQANFSDMIAIEEIITTNFIQFDPLVNYLRISADEMRTRLKPFLETSISDGLCIVARNAEDDIVGVCAAYDYGFQFKSANLPPSIRNYSQFFKELSKPFRSKTTFNPSRNEYLDAGYMAVDVNYYGLDIPRLLENQLNRVAAQRGYKWLIAEFSNTCNFYLHKRIYGDLLEVLNVLRFRDFVNDQGDKPMLAADGECMLTKMIIPNTNDIKGEEL